MATIKDLFKLVNSTYGESNKIAMSLLLESLDNLDWTTLDGNLLTPLAAAYETLPEGPGKDGYRALLMKTSDYCRSLQKNKGDDRHLTIHVHQDGSVTLNKQ